MNAIEFAPLQRGALQELPNPLLHALGPFDIQLEARDLLVEHGGAPSVEDFGHDSSCLRLMTRWSWKACMHFKHAVRCP